MDELLEAQKFNAELDRLLAGETPAEPAADLAFAARLRASDLSRESGVRKTLKLGLLGYGTEKAVSPWRFNWRVAAAYAGAFTVLMAPLVAHLISQSSDNEAGQLRAGFDSKGPMFDETGGVYEMGAGGVAAGAIPGSAPDVITPLNTRDPSGYMLDASEAPPSSREGYDHIVENGLQRVADHPLSTFSIEVDAASYANVRRFLNQGQLPPKDAVRVAELVNYFPYAYPEPAGKDPFSITAEAAACPWNAKHALVRIGLKGRSIATADLPPNNLVFLIDSSGSMMDADKLPLLKKAFRLLVQELRPQDRVAIVTYAGAAGLVLPSTSGRDKEGILAALNRLEAGGSTAGSAGIQLAYRVAAENLLKKGVNRVILATDGDFNVGTSSDGELVRLIEGEREKGVFLTVLGFGQGNYQDAKMKKLADAGNGNYAYVDTLGEARKVLVREMGATLLTIAKDVKVQVEFNPARAEAYRLIGYEERLLKPEDFNDDKKDAGELGAGRAVTALYEVVPAGAGEALPSVDPLKYQKKAEQAQAAAGSELLTVKLRYKDPEGGASRLLTRPLDDSRRPWSQASPDLKFAASVAGFGMLLRDSDYAGDLTFDKVSVMAKEGRGPDAEGTRAEFLELVDKAKVLGRAPKLLR